MDWHDNYVKLSQDYEAKMSKESCWKAHNGLGSGLYIRRFVPLSSPLIPNELFEWEWQYRTWQEYCHSNLGACKPSTVKELEIWIAAQNEHRLVNKLATTQCHQCHLFHNNLDWTGFLCYDCAGDQKMVCSKCAAYIKKSYWPNSTVGPLCFNCAQVKANYVMAKVKAEGFGSFGLSGSFSHPVVSNVAKQPPKKGDVRKLPKVSSALYTDQWHVVGSAMEPYIVSRKLTPDGSTTDEGWCCACRAFTQHKIREDCKHILRVKNFEGIALSLTSVHVDQKEAFEKFLEMEKAKKAASNGTTLIGPTGRKFR